jgi:ADP-heptose:LPS heptosyltransferase
LPSEPPIRRVLVYRLGSLGDTVVALPCYRLIARLFSGAERRLLTNFPVNGKAPASAAVLGDTGLFHSYMRYTVGTRRPDELLRLAWQIRRFRPDLLIYLMFVRPWKSVVRDRTFFRLAGVRRIVGISVTDQELKHLFNPATGCFETEASRLARLISEVGDAAVDDLANWSLSLNNAERQAAANALGALGPLPLIVCGPGTKMQAKDWGQENWRALLNRLHATYPSHALVLVGAAEEAALAEFVSAEWNGRKVNLCGRLTPRETAAVIERGQIFLGHDSGPMHLAASVGTPAVIAFSAAGIPGAWFPAGPRHQIVYHRTSCCNCQLETCTVEARRCMTSITVSEVHAAAVRALRGEPGQRDPVVIP